ncbi:MAG: hypothetical protein IT370_25955 [Deltaproteobacteria bacterium]|nr:hypothetical protein [Deltaproteobacteria bacterium]
MRKLSLLGLWVLVAAASAAGCGDDDDGGKLDAAVVGGDGGARDGAVLPTPCPATPPQVNDACPRAGLVCEYGDDPRESCHTVATCNGTWSIVAPRCTALPPVICPATREAAAGQDCTPMDAYCSYGDNLDCHCTNCREFPVAGCAGPLRWDCDAPNVDPMCPAGKPALGGGCAPDDQRCVYSCGQDGARECKAGVWTAAQGGPCPISSRQAKRDIHYVDPAEAAALARAVESTRLATWEYLDPTLGRGRRLGFIIEDQAPDSPAVEPGGAMVNQYGYISMLVAAVQAQRQEIDQLRKEVEALRRQQPRRPRQQRAR